MGLEMLGETEVLNSFRHTDAATYNRDLRVVREDACERGNPIGCDPTVIIGEGDHVPLSELYAKVPTAGDATRLRANVPQPSVTEPSDCNLRFITVALIDHEQLVEALVGQNSLGAGQGVVRAVPGYKSNRDSNGALALTHRQTRRLPSQGTSSSTNGYSHDPVRSAQRTVQ